MCWTTTSVAIVHRMLQALAWASTRGCAISMYGISFMQAGRTRCPLREGQWLLTQGLGAHIAGGWSLQGIATVQDGQPFTVACTTTTTAGLGCNALKVPGQNPYAGPHNAAQFLYPAALCELGAQALPALLRWVDRSAYTGNGAGLS